MASKREVANHLRGAAERIVKYGWIQNSFGSKSKGFCLMGATGFGHGDVVYFADVTIQQYLKTKKNNWDIAGWNDTPGRTKKEVLGVLRGAAAWLEHGGSWT